MSKSRDFLLKDGLKKLVFVWKFSSRSNHNIESYSIFTGVVIKKTPCTKRTKINNGKVISNCFFINHILYHWFICIIIIIEYINWDFSSNQSINHTIYSVTIKISHGHGVPWKNAILFKEMIKWIIYTLYEWQSTLFQKRKCLVSGDLLTQIGIILFKWSFIRFLETIVIVYWYVLEKNLTCKNWENIKM